MSPFAFVRFRSFDPAPLKLAAERPDQPYGAK
jgi:hypothetical protein